MKHALMVVLVVLLSLGTIVLGGYLMINPDSGLSFIERLELGHFIILAFVLSITSSHTKTIV